MSADNHSSPVHLVADKAPVLPCYFWPPRRAYEDGTKPTEWQYWDDRDWILQGYTHWTKKPLKGPPIVYPAAFAIMDRLIDLLEKQP